MAINPCKTVSFNFVADGVTDAVQIDITREPVGVSVNGNAPTSLSSVKVSSTFGDITAFTATYDAGILTLTFTDPPVATSVGAPIIYTVTLVLVYPNVS